MNNRDSIFISHANPENNYFANWLASKLALLGYKVWVDKKAIRHGSYFTLDYEKEISENTCVFLACISNKYIDKVNTPDSGVYNELYKARTIGTQIVRVPLMLEKNLFSELPSGLLGVDACFFDNWGKGLKDLVGFFEEKGINRHEIINNPISLWFNAQNIINAPIEKKEFYRTNWFETSLPPKISIARGESYKDYLSALKDSKIIFIEHSGYIVTFSPIAEITKHISLYDEYEFATDSFISDDPIVIHDKLSFIDPPKILVRLMNTIFKVFLQRKHLIRYVSENNKTNKKRNIFHYPFNEENKKRVSLKKFNKSNRAVVSKNPSFYWHFGISFNANLNPFVGYTIRYHLIFKDLKNEYLSKDDQHELRRSLPNLWFNRKWFEMLLAMILKISGNTNDDYIKVFYDSVNFYKLNLLPIGIKSNIGYIEPDKEYED